MCRSGDVHVKRNRKLPTNFLVNVHLLENLLNTTDFLSLCVAAEMKSRMCSVLVITLYSSVSVWGLIKCIAPESVDSMVFRIWE